MLKSNQFLLICIARYFKLSLKYLAPYQFLWRYEKIDYK
jgi:hypothetical protein